MGDRLPTWALLKCVDWVWFFKNWSPVAHTVVPLVAFTTQSAVGTGEWHFSRSGGGRAGGPLGGGGRPGAPQAASGSLLRGGGEPAGHLLGRLRVAARGAGEEAGPKEALCPTRSQPRPLLTPEDALGLRGSGSQTCATALVTLPRQSPDRPVGAEATASATSGTLGVHGREAQLGKGCGARHSVGPCDSRNRQTRD